MTFRQDSEDEKSGVVEPQHFLELQRRELVSSIATVSGLEMSKIGSMYVNKWCVTCTMHWCKLSLACC